MPDKPAGKVFRVGAGPGDPGLISLRAAECLKSADLVLYDGLVNPLLLQLTQAECRRTARVRRDDGDAIVPQQQINQQLIHEARSGKTVVRLKGGDPCIFGRGSEESAALAEAGIPFEIVPGITAATAAAEYAGFSLTHRGVSSAVAFITGHEDPSRETNLLDYAGLARFPGTLVFYMGLARLADICQQLIDAGKHPETPAAVICKATLPSQRIVVSSLKELPLRVADSNLTPPSLIVVGNCLLLRDQKSWFENLPLFGISVGITRPLRQCEETASQIVRLGGEPVVMPMITVEDVDADAAAVIRERLKLLSSYQWLIFTSTNGVSHFMRHLRSVGLDTRDLQSARIAAIGDSTAKVLAEHWLRADLVPTEFRAESLARALAPHVPGQRCLWLKASRGRDVLPKLLSQAGAIVDELPVYQNLDKAAFDDAVVSRLLTGLLHWVGISSPSIARQFARLLQQNQISMNELQTRIASISPLTTEALQQAGLTVSAEAAEATWPEILKAICVQQSL